MFNRRQHGLREELPLHIRSLYRYALALTREEDAAHDLVQECCALALDNERRFKRGTNLKAWLFTIMHNRHISLMRRRRRGGESVPLNEAAAWLPQPSDQMARLEYRDLVAGFDRLGEQFREVLVLVSVEGLSYREVSDVLGIPVGTVTSRLSRARSMLRDYMAHGADAPEEPRGADVFRVVK